MATPEWSILENETYALAPDMLLTSTGARREKVLSVSHGRVESIVGLSEFVRKNPERSITSLPGRAIVPGFIDSHTHVGQTFGKAVICGEPAQIWLRIWNPLERVLDPHRCYVAAKWMFLEALRGGYTTIVNYTLNSVEKNTRVHEAARETGIRLVSATGFDDPVAVPSDSATQQTINRESVIKRLEQHIEHCSETAMIYPSLCCNGFQSAPLETISVMAKYCNDHEVIFQMHANEHFPEVHGCILAFGKRPIELSANLGVLGPWTLLHHATLTSENEIELLKASNTAISYNPVASQWKGNGVAPAVGYARRGIRMGLGTDATRMDAFRTLDAAESCQRIAHGLAIVDFSSGAGWTWVDAGTRGAADACGLGKEIGTLDAGFAADFLILDMNRPEVIPSWDFEWELVRYYNRDQIDAVVINGKLVMTSGAPVGWDHEAFLREYAGLATETVESANIVRLHGPSSNYRSGS